MGGEHGHGGGHDHGHAHEGCGHDHGHDHGHDAHGHEGCGHDHGHDAHGHDAHGHEECGHDHGHGDHGHAVKKAPRPPGDRPAEDGGTALQLALEDTLPDESDDKGRFEKLERALEAQPGIKDVHLRTDGAHPEVCIHYDPAAVPARRLVEVARAVGAEVAERYRQRTWLVRGMEAARCADVIAHAVGRAKGVLSAEVAYASERLVVELDAERFELADVERRLTALGYVLEEPERGHVCSMHAHGGGLAPRLQMPFALAAGVLLAAGFALEAAGVPGYAPRAAYLASLALGGFFPLRATLASLRERQLDVEMLMVLAGVGAAALGAWMEGAFLLFLFTLGHALEHRAMERARRSIEALARLRPATAFVKQSSGPPTETEVRWVRRGDVVVVRPGDRIPLDGVVHDGASSVNQATITGESIPVAKSRGDEVFAGTLNQDAALEVEVTKLEGDSLLARIVDMVARAEAQKGRTQRFARDVERRLVPIVLVLAVAVPLAMVAFGAPVGAAALRGIALVVAASPCALAISTPAAVLAAVGAAARSGVLVKGGAHLEALGTVGAVAFDKTGTLTRGEPEVKTLSPAEGVAEAELLGVAAGVEALSSHPLARAVTRAASARGVAAREADGCVAEHGKGLRASVDGAPALVGSVALFGDGVVPADLRQAVARAEGEGQTTMIVRHGARFLGVIGVADAVRPEARGALRALEALGLERTVILSGDNATAARAVGKDLGVREVRAPLLPDGKVRAIRELAKEGGVAMVGDGVNDAPALAAATVGVAMGGAGSDAALETADIVLMGDRIERLPFVFALARAARAVMRQNVVIAVGVSAVLVVATIAGWTSIAHAVVLHEGSTLVVVANALRLLRHATPVAESSRSAGPAPA